MPSGESRRQGPRGTTPERGPFRLQTFSALSNRDYRYLWISNTFSSTANWVQQITLALLVVDQTDGSPFWVVTVLGIRALPILLIGPLAGVAVDRLNRKALLMSTQLFLVVLATFFALGVRQGEINEYHALLFSFLLGLDMAINQPVRQSLIANVVPREGLTNAIALDNSARTLIRVIAPAIGIALITPFGLQGNFFVQAAAYLVAFMIVIPMRTPYREGVADGASVAGSFVEGLRYIKADTTLLLLIVLIIVPSVLIHATEYLLVIFADDILPGNGKLALVALYTSIGVGSLIGAVAVASLGNFQSKGPVSMASLLVVTVLLVLFGLTPYLALSVVLIGFIGLFNMVFRIANNALVQTRIPDALRGRITSIYVLDHGVIPLGSPVLGLLAVALGAGHAVAVAGVFAFGVTAFMGLRWHELWRLR